MKKTLASLAFAMTALTVAEKVNAQTRFLMDVAQQDTLLPPIPKNSERMIDLGRAKKGSQYLDVFVTPRYDTLAAIPDEKGATVMTLGLRSIYDGVNPQSARGEVRFDMMSPDYQENFYAIYNDNQFEVLSRDTVTLVPYDSKLHGRVTWQKAGQKAPR